MSRSKWVKTGVTGVSVDLVPVEVETSEHPVGTQRFSHSDRALVVDVVAVQVERAERRIERQRFPNRYGGRRPDLVVVEIEPCERLVRLESMCDCERTRRPDVVVVKREALEIRVGEEGPRDRLAASGADRVALEMQAPQRGVRLEDVAGVTVCNGSPEGRSGCNGDGW